MFGIGLYAAYSSYTIDIFGGTSAALLVALVTRLFVGIGWFRMFQKAGRNGFLAFAPIVGPYTAFRLAWDDFSFSAIFGMTTTIAFIASCGASNGIIAALSVLNFIMWWFLAFLSGRAYGFGMILSFLYGGIPWLGVPLAGFWPASEYKGAWSSDPEDERNLTTQQRKKRRKKAAKEVQRREREAKEASKRASKAQDK